VSPYLLYVLCLIVYGGLAIRQARRFRQARDRIAWRVHVNGIRGKSTVTRYVAAIFRTAGYRTFGKTTGSAARILQPDGQDFDFGRRGFPDVNEQVRILWKFSMQRAEAAVMECMAVNPLYGEWLEHKVMSSHLGILTNVRLDHMDYLGDTLPQIARSLARATPKAGLLITAEDNPELQQILRAKAAERGSTLLIADPASVNTESLEGFNHFAIKTNVAIGYLVADQLGLDRQQALQAMQRAQPDPGAFRLQQVQRDGNRITWANLFAVNDRESFVDLCERLFVLHPKHQRVVILNNRRDRQTRVELFAELAVQLAFDLVVSFGDFEAEVNQVLARHQWPVLNLGNSSPQREASGEQLLAQILHASSSTRPLLLIGTVNIHTTQAERLLHVMSNSH
jgi:poly-gamma-glutamate synthase PgsB/CapB